jgi:hypothetical protein
MPILRNIKLSSQATKVHVAKDSLRATTGGGAIPYNEIASFHSQ